MRELFGLKLFQVIFALLFSLGFISGTLIGIYLFSAGKFKFYILIPSIPALYFIVKGLYKNTILFLMDLKTISTKV